MPTAQMREGCRPCSQVVQHNILTSKTRSRSPGRAAPTAGSKPQKIAWQADHWSLPGLCRFPRWARDSRPALSPARTSAVALSQAARADTTWPFAIASSQIRSAPSRHLRVSRLTTSTWCVDRCYPVQQISNCARMPATSAPTGLQQPRTFAYGNVRAVTATVACAHNSHKGNRFYASWEYMHYFFGPLAECAERHLQHDLQK